MLYAAPILHQAAKSNLQKLQVAQKRLYDWQQIQNGEPESPPYMNELMLIS